jgi:hypothetical protein
VEIGAIFILLVVLIVFAGACVLLFGIGSALRRGKLHPEGDKIEGQAADGDSRNGASAQRPQHRRVRSRQRTHFVPHR